MNTCLKKLLHSDNSQFIPPCDILFNPVKTALPIFDNENKDVSKVSPGVERSHVREFEFVRMQVTKASTFLVLFLTQPSAAGKYRITTIRQKIAKP